MRSKRNRVRAARSLKRTPRFSTIERLEDRRLLVSDWQNQNLALDVTNDLVVSPLDVLAIVNDLNSEGMRRLGFRNSRLAPYLDVDGDGTSSPLDVLNVVNHLNSTSFADRSIPRVEGEAAFSPAGFLSIPMMKLPGSSGQVVPLSTTLNIGREEFNEMGIFVAEDSSGRVNGILPGEPGYAEAVFDSSQRRVLYSRFGALRLASDSILPAGSFAHVYVLQGISDNSDPSQHLRARQISTNLMRVGWEEHVSPFGGWAQVGDRGYDDATVDFQIGEPFDGNAEPVIRAIPNQTINELTQFAITAFAMDADMPDDTIVYSLDIDPSGASIDAVTGRITWTPTEAQGPGNFEFLVRATDEAGAFDTESFFVTVLEVNQSPVLQAIPNFTRRPGELVTFQAIATDADLPIQQLTYTLLPGSPTGATINPTTGEFRWQLPQNQASGNYPVTIRVTDNGSPVLSDTKSFTVSVGCSFDDNLTGWTVFESGGTNLGKGTVTTSGCAATIREGDSFAVGLQKSFTIPDTPTALQFTFSGPEFDATATGFIRDAFEVALVDTDGNPLVAPFTTGRDALFNSTEGMQPATGRGIQVDGNTVTVGLNGIPAGTDATFILRLINNDGDKTTSVSIRDIRLIGNEIAEFSAAYFRSLSIEASDGHRIQTVLSSTGLPAVVNQFSNKSSVSNDEAFGSILTSDAAGSSSGVFHYVDWRSADPLMGTAEGIISLPDGSVVTVTFTAKNPDGSRGSFYFGQTDGIFNFNFWTPEAPWISESVRNIPPAGDIIALIGGVHQTYTVTLSEPIRDPIMAILSLGQAGLPTDYVFDAPFEIVSQGSGGVFGGGLLTKSDTTLTGVEGHGTIMFDGVFSEFDWTVPRPETWHGFTFGIRTSLAIEPELLPPTISISAPARTMTSGSQVTLNGIANASRFQADFNSNRITSVLLNGKHVDVLDANGQFFEQVTIHAGVNVFNFTAEDSLGASAQVTLEVFGASSDSASADFSRYVDITSALSGEYFRTSYDSKSSLLSVDLSTRNSGLFQVDVPLLVGVKNISEPTVQLVGFDGITPDFVPYYDYTGSVSNGVLSPGARTESPTVLFHNPNQVPFTYELVFYGKTNSSPSFTSVPKIEGLVDKEYRYVVTATDEDGDPLSFQLREAPAGMSINSQTGVVTWTPQTGDVGSPRVSIEVSDPRGGRATQSFTLNVNVPPPNRPPVITSVPRTQASISQNDSPPPSGPIDLKNWTVLDYEIGDGPSRWDIAEDGLSVTQRHNSTASAFLSDFALSNQVVEGKFSSSGGDDDLIGFVFGFQEPGKHFIFDWKRGTQPDACGTAEAGMTIKYVSASSPFTCTDFWATNPQNGRVDTLFHNSIPWEIGIEYGFRLSIEDTNVTVEVTQGSQVLESTVISTVRLTQGKFGFYNYSQADVSYVGFTRQAIVGVPYQYQVTAVDAENDLIRYALTSLPQGMSIDNQTGLVRWSPTPDQIGDHEVEVEVSDGRGGIATQKFVVCVHPDPSNHAPIIVSDPPTVTSVSTPYSYTVQAVDADSDVLSFQLLSGPTGLSISESTGLLTWNSPAIGSHVVKVQVADGRGGSDTQEFELRVAGAGLGTIRGTKWNDINFDGVFGHNENRIVQDAIIRATDVLHLAGRDDIEIPDLENGRYYAIGRPEFQLDLRYQKETKPQAIPVSSGSIITLESPATGRINFYGSETFEYDFLTPDGNPHPDGGGGAFLTSLGGISLYSGPPGALLGLFLSDENPRESPPGGLDFTLNGLGREFFELKPKIGQIFFMGDGFTAAGVAQRFVAPEGATRLFMGTPDAFFFVGGPGYYLDNDGEYFARIIVSNGIIQEPTLGGWTIYLDQNQNGRLDDGERSTVTDANGNYEFTDLPAGTYYVAEVQQSGWTQTFPSQSISGAELIVGGSFEDATLEQGVSIFWKGSRLEPVWDVIEDSVDVVHRSFFISSTGNYSVDLTGTPGDGAISQTVSTVPGARYRLSFDLAGNPLAAPAIKQLLVSAGSVSRSFEFDVSGFDAQSLAYRRESFEFVATSERTLIVFDSMTPGIGGPVIDSVSLRQLSQAKTHVVELGSNSIVANVNFGNSQIGSSSRSINFFSQPPLAALSNEVWLYDAIAQTSSPEAIVAYAGVSVPSGMTVHPQLGIVAWQPTIAQVGKHTVILQATDTTGNSATQVFEIEVVLPNTAPLFTVTPSTNAVATRAYESVVAAQDAEGDAILYRLVNGPTGLSLNQREVPNASGDVLRVERFLTWTPTAAQIGSHTVRIEARDARGAASELEFTIQVAATGSNRLPTITSQARKSTIVDRMYAYAPTANDLDSQRLVWSLSHAPTGMAINPDSGFITWTPTTQQLGDHSITLSVSDGAGGIANQSFTLNVSNEFRNTAPLIVSNPRLYALEGQGYRYDVVSEDEDYDPIHYRLVAAPHGMSIDASRGTIRWTPTNQQFGEHSVVIEASDPYGATGTQRFTVNVNCVNSPPMIVSVPLTTALTERTYIYPVRATDLESGPLRFKLLSSPTGMSINADTGLIRWNPSTQQLGEHTVTVEVTDEAGAVGLQVYKIVVRSSDEPVDPNNPDGPKLGNRAPLFTSTPVFNAKSGVVYQYTVSAIDPDGDAISFALQNPPAGMTISASGVITWAPALGTNGTYPITISATDVHGARTNQAFALNVAANSAPVITSQPVTIVAAGAIYRYAVRATDADDDPLAYALEGAPDGMSIDRLGLIRWETKQSDLGTKSFTVRVTDSFGQSATQAVSLIVAADTTGPAVSISVFGGRPDRSNGIQVDLGSTYTVQVQATDDVGVVSRSLKVNGIEQPLSSSFAVQLVGNQLGIVELRGAARDAAGNETTYNLSITIFDPASVNLIPNDPTAPPRNGGSDPNDKRAPFVDITSPELGASVTNVVTIRGTVDDPEDRLWYWRLYYARMDQISTAALDLSDTDWVMIRQGTTEVINGELGQFDPTMLSRDGYVIALVAYDLNGAGEIVGTVVNVEGNLQVGNFRLEFTDVTIPLAGIPITINRVYDTVNANDKGDFGYGWSFGVQDPRILEAGAIGQGGGLNFSTDRFIPDKTKVFLTNPEGRRVGFTYKEELVSASLFGGIFRPYFVADPGVYDTLTIDETQVARGGIIGALAQGINPDNYTLTTKSGMKYRYNQNAGLQTITDRNGNVVTFSDTEIRHSLGQTIQLVRDHRGRIREIQLPTEQNQAVRNLLYTYDASGNLIRFTDQTGLVTRYEYLSSPAHYLDKVYDPLGKKVIEAIYENRRFIGMFDALGNEVGRQTIDTARNRGIVRDANGFETVLIYNDRGNVIEEIDPLGFKTIRRYEDPRNVDLETTIIDRNGNVTNREYDSRGNATRIIERGPQSNPLARPVITEFTYDSGNNVTSIKNSAGATTAFAFDASGQVTRIANALTATSGFTYDSQGRRQSFTDFNGNTTRFEYDEACPCGSPSRLINPDGTYQTFEYNDYGQVTAERTFEANGTLVEQKLTEYDAAGKVTREVMGAGNDPLHPPSEIRKFYSGNLLDWEIIVNPVSLNADGSLKESPSTPISQRKSRITDYVYDAADRLIRQIDANGGVVNFRYDAQGNRLLLQDPVGNITTWVYDGNNRMIEERDPLYWDKYIKANAAEFAGKVGDALLDQVIIANRKASGASLANNQGAPHVRSYGYDPNGNQIEIIDRNNRRREFSHDHAGRVIEERWYAENNGPLVETISFSFDILGNMLTAENSVSKYTYTYDILNRLKSVDNLDSNPDTPHVILYYDYDAQGNVLRTYDDSGVTVESTYNSRNQLATRKWFDAVVPAGQAPDVDDARVDFSYNAAGRQKQIRRYSDLAATTKVGTTDTTYDLAGRTKTLIHRNAVDALLSSYDYGYDFSGLVVDEQRNHQDPQHRQTITYNYDLTGQLVDAFFSGQDDEHYEYDLNGNRIRSVVGDEVRVYITGVGNRLLSDGINEYEYDGEGNVITQSSVLTLKIGLFSFNHVSFTTQARQEVNGLVIFEDIRYQDAFGRVIKSDSFESDTGKTDSTSIVYHELVVTWLHKDSERERRILVGESGWEILAEHDIQGEMSWFLSDRNFTVATIVNDSDVRQVSFSVFGIPLAVGDQRSILFGGAKYDNQLEMYHNSTRYYLPSAGRFMSVDTIGFRGDPSNLYRYALNSPVSFVDPFGTMAVESASLNRKSVEKSQSLRCAAGQLGVVFLEFTLNVIFVSVMSSHYGAGTPKDPVFQKTIEDLFKQAGEEHDRLKRATKCPVPIQRPLPVTRLPLNTPFRNKLTSPNRNIPRGGWNKSY